MQITPEQKELALRYVRENQKDHAMSCSESVFNAFVRSGIVDVDPEWTRLATGFSGGVAASGNTCGAIYGGLMALGWLFGRHDPRHDTTEGDYRMIMMRRFNRFVHDMEDAIGTSKCGDILKNSGGYFDDKRVMKCPEIMVLAVETALKYIEMDEEESRAMRFGENILGFE